METVQQFFDLEAFRIPSVRPTDILEILIIAFLVYHVLLWAKNSRLWSMLKGVIVIMAFILFAEFFQMNTILWIVGNFFNVIITVVVIILQPLSFEKRWKNLEERISFPMHSFLEI